MSLIEGIENKAISWAWNKWLLNSIRHWRTSLVGISSLLGAIGALVNYLQQLAAGGAPDIQHIEWIVGLFTAAIAGFSAKDAGVPDVAYDATGKPIPRAEVVQ